jgi:predicted acyl esterase
MEKHIEAVDNAWTSPIMRRGIAVLVQLTCAVIVIVASSQVLRLDAYPADSGDESSVQKPPGDPRNVPGEYIPTGPKYKYKLYREVRVPMPDGVEIAAVIVRPDVEGRFPAIMFYSPYRSLSGIREKYRDDTLYNGFQDGPAYFAERGYAVVAFDVRGTGDSGGSSGDMYGDQERRDAYDMVEWIAAQPWCSGKVGMWGYSYTGVDQWQVGAQQPPHLAT